MPEILPKILFSLPIFISFSLAVLQLGWPAWTGYLAAAIYGIIIGLS